MRNMLANAFLLSVLLGSVAPLTAQPAASGPKPQVARSTLLAPLPPLTTPAASVPEPLIPQQTDLWCWAASGEMVMRYFGRIEAQCAQATQEFALAPLNCCNVPHPKKCVHGGQVFINHYGFTYQQLGGASALTPNQIVDQIVTRSEPWITNPYCADSTQCGNWGHVTTGIGYWWPFTGPGSDDANFVLINDPWPPDTGATYYQSYLDYRTGCWFGNGFCSGYAEGWDIYDIVAPKYPPKVFQPDAVAAPSFSPEEKRRLMKGDADAVAEAQLAWRLLRGAVTKEHPDRFGFDSPAQAANAQLAAPIEQFDIRLSHLRAWNGQAAAMPLLERAEALLVPVEAGGRLRSGIRLRRDGNLWRLSAFGNPQFTAAWERAHSAGGEFIVFVEGLEVSFAGRRNGNELMLISLFNEPDYELKAGDQQPARQILRRLQQAAAEYQGNGATLRPGR